MFFWEAQKEITCQKKQWQLCCGLTFGLASKCESREQVLFWSREISITYLRKNTLSTPARKVFKNYKKYSFAFKSVCMCVCRCLCICVSITCWHSHAQEKARAHTHTHTHGHERNARTQHTNVHTKLGPSHGISVLCVCVGFALVPWLKVFHRCSRTHERVCKTTQNEAKRSNAQHIKTIPNEPKQNEKAEDKQNRTKTKTPHRTHASQQATNQPRKQSSTQTDKGNTHNKQHTMNKQGIKQANKRNKT